MTNTQYLLFPFCILHHHWSKFIIEEYARHTIVSTADGNYLTCEKKHTTYIQSRLMILNQSNFYISATDLALVT